MESFDLYIKGLINIGEKSINRRGNYKPYEMISFKYQIKAQEHKIKAQKHQIITQKHKIKAQEHRIKAQEHIIKTFKKDTISTDETCSICYENSINVYFSQCDAKHKLCIMRAYNILNSSSKCPFDRVSVSTIRCVTCERTFNGNFGNNNMSY